VDFLPKNKIERGAAVQLFFEEKKKKKKKLRRAGEL
jgi:hypothetical protein